MTSGKPSRPTAVESLHLVPVTFAEARGFTAMWHRHHAPRVTTDGTPNACSMLYAASWRAASALGYCRLVTYTQRGESGESLRAAGWRLIAQRPPHSGWDRPSRPRQAKGTEHIPRTLWEAAS
jgi:hypothetical protein